MDPKEKKKKQRLHGRLVRYLRRDGQKNIVEAADGGITKYRRSIFHPYFVSTDPDEIFQGVTRHHVFGNNDPSKEETNNEPATEKEETETQIEEDFGDVLMENGKRKYKQQITRTIKPTTSNPPTQIHALR